MNNRPLEIYLFHCSNSLDTNALRQGLNGRIVNELKTVSLPCSGKVNLLYLLKAFERGADGVMLVTCEQGECNFLEGNLRAKKRSEAVESILEETGLGKGRMTVIHQNNEGGVKQILNELGKFSDSIRILSQKQ